MKIVYLAAGAADMICGSCLHDNTLVAALQKAGHDALLAPTYTPLRTDEDNVSLSRVRFGGINIYLQQASPLARFIPGPVQRLLDRPGLIRFFTRLAPSVDASKLGPLAVSMLRGEDGPQRAEIAKLVNWLDDEIRPDVVHLSNTMLVGMAREIRRLGIPVVSTLSGEDLFIEQLREPHYSAVREILRERVAELDALVAMNHYYADFMADYLGAPRDRIEVIPHGLKLDGHGPVSHRAIAGDSAASGLSAPGLSASGLAGSGERTIGYLARICPEKGLHLLVEAWRRLMANPAAPPVRLRVAGYVGAGDRAYLQKILREVAAGGRPERFEYVGEVTREQKIAFLQGLDVFSVPTVYPESKGLSVLEAWANGVPVVAPDHGAFGEMIRATDGGALCRPLDSQSLADEILRLLVDRERAQAAGERGRQAVLARYHSGAMAERTLLLYQRLARPSSEPAPAAAHLGPLLE